MSYTPEQLKEWADSSDAQLARIHADPTYHATGVWYRAQLRAHADALEEIKALKAKLKVAEEREGLY